MSLFLALVAITGFASATDVDDAFTKARIARMEADRAHARIDGIEKVNGLLVCSQIVDELNRGKNPWWSLPTDKWEDAVAKKIAQCGAAPNQRDGAEIQAAWNAWKLRSGAPAAAPTTTTATPPATPAAQQTAPAAATPPTSPPPAAENWWDGGDEGVRLSAGLGVDGSYVDGHGGLNPRHNSFLGATSVELRYGLGVAGLNVRGSFAYEFSGGTIYAVQFVPDIYVDKERAFFRVGPVIGYSMQTMETTGAAYKEDRLDLGLTVAGRFDRNWEIVGTGVRGIDPDTANTPDNSWRFGLQFRGTLDLNVSNRSN